MMDIGKDLQDAYECGRQDALNELMKYTYAMLTAEKFGLQHKIMSMMADRKTEPQTEDLQDWKDRMWAEAIVTEPTSSKMEQVDKDINVRSKTEPQTERSE